MVIGERFVWGHIGKTGGDAIASLFAAIPLLAHTIDPPDRVEKHDTFGFRGIQKEVYALNIRKLPNWIVSVYNHHRLAPEGVDTLSTPSVAPGNPPVIMPEDKALLQSKQLPVDLSETNFPDRILKLYSDGYEITWLRMEMLRVDFVRFVNRFVRPLTAEEVAVAMTLPTKTPNPYDHDISKWLTEEQVKRLYENNPYWASVEEKCYRSVI